MATITDHEQQEIDAANASGRTPVVFVHGLWLLSSSWDRWARFSRRPVSLPSPELAGRPDSVDQANAQPEVFAHKTVGQVADHYQE